MQGHFEGFKNINRKWILGISIEFVFMIWGERTWKEINEMKVKVKGFISGSVGSDSLLFSRPISLLSSPFLSSFYNLVPNFKNEFSSLKCV